MTKIEIGAGGLDGTVGNVWSEKGLVKTNREKMRTNMEKVRLAQ